jgi:hypothetical protein
MLVGGLVVVSMLIVGLKLALGAHIGHGRPAGARGEPARPARPSTGLARPTAQTASKAKYGGLPSWLPKATVPVGRVVHASAGHPVLGIEGDTVAVALGHGRALVTAVGPEVPHQGQYPVPATSPCTFIVTFASASGELPVETHTFTLTDEYGHVHHPVVGPLAGGLLQRHGRTFSLRISDVLPTGNGTLTWAPEGGRAIVSWDFAVEID